MLSPMKNSGEHDAPRATGEDAEAARECLIGCVCDRVHNFRDRTIGQIKDIRRLLRSADQIVARNAPPLSIAQRR